MTLVVNTRQCRVKTGHNASFLLCAAFSLLLVLMLTGCGSDTELKKHSFIGSTMGTRYHITVIAAKSSVPNDLDEQLQNRLDQLNRIFSTYLPNSELNKLNQKETGAALAVSEELYQVLRLAQYVYGETNGAYNPAVGPLVDLWGFGAAQVPEQIPTQAVIEKQQKAIDFRELTLIENSRQVIKSKALQIDLSAIAKGYAVDQVAELLNRMNLTDYLVEIGGELRLSGYNLQDKLWRIGVEQPTLERGTAQKVLQLTNIGLATSGDYRNYIEREGVRYSHTINPQSGWPVKNNLASVTVLHSQAAIADALATAFMVMGNDRALQYVTENEIAAYFIVKEGDQFLEHQSPRFNHYLSNTGEQ